MRVGIPTREGRERSRRRQWDDTTYCALYRDGLNHGLLETAPSVCAAAATGVL